MISVTKYFILNFTGYEGKTEKDAVNSEFIAVLRQAHSTEMGSINNLLKNNVSQATY